MKVAIINKSDSTGGAAVVSFRLMEALRSAGVDARMIVEEKLTDSQFVETCAGNLRIKIPFLTERLKIFVKNGFSRATLFKIDTASDGIDLSKNKFVRDADIVCLNWVNQGMLSFRDIEKILDLGKPVVWTMHDMWCMTGICHHAGDCEHFRRECGDCHLLGRMKGKRDLSYKIWKKKKKLYSSKKITFVAVSSWLAERALKSSLLSAMKPEVIPNAFRCMDTPGTEESPEKETNIKTIVFGAARLDDPIKGLPILMEATRMLSREHPEEASLLRLVTFGNIKDPDTMKNCGLPHSHLGLLRGESAVKEIYLKSDIVVSSSLYETLPGTLVEGQAYGCIPVCFDRGGQKDIVDHLSTGYIAHFSDNPEESARNLMKGLLWAMTARSEIRDRMRKSVERRFSYKSVAEKYIALFNRLLSHS